MKKLLFAAILTIGCFTMSQAQQFSWFLGNASATETWKWALDDAGISPAVYETMLPMQTATGSFNNFAFPIEWKAEDSNGCYLTQFNLGPTAVINAGTTCLGTNVKYQVGTIAPFVHYYIKAEFD